MTVENVSELIVIIPYEDAEIFLEVWKCESFSRPYLVD